MLEGFPLTAHIYLILIPSKKVNALFHEDNRILRGLEHVQADQLLNEQKVWMTKNQVTFHKGFNYSAHA